MSLNLIIKRTGGASQEFPVDIDPSSTVAELKEKIAATVELSAENIRLVCAGRVWDNVATVESYNVAAGSRVHCLNNPTRTAPAAAAQTLTSVDPMQQMMASQMPQLDPNSTDPMEQMHAQMHQQMMQNPQMMRDMMNSPMVQQMMSDPDTLQNMLRMNPRMNQLMEQRPEIARMLQDPELIQQSMRMMQNPELMREMQRQQDRGMANLDVMPGGHAALMQAHQDILDPLHAAMAPGGDGAAGGVTQPTYDNTAAAELPPLSNPWGAPASAPAPAAAPPPMPAAASLPAAAPASGAPNPMQQMMQQMMANPAMMQSMMGNQAMPQMPNAAPTSPLQQGTSAPNPTPNPMQQMMQQMMNNPAMMQQAMAMTQQMMNRPGQAQGGANAMGGGFNPGAFGGPNLQAMMQQMNAAQQMNAGQQGAGQAEVPEAILKARFASQLVQLANMGFSDEGLCLRALQQHNGRVDSAIDALLTGS